VKLITKDMKIKLSQKLLWVANIEVKLNFFNERMQGEIKESLF